jgi:hypothetical protein
MRVVISEPPASAVDPDEPQTALGIFLGHTPARWSLSGIQLIGFGLVGGDFLFGDMWLPAADLWTYLIGTGLVVGSVVVGVRRGFVGPIYVSGILSLLAMVIALSPLILLGWIVERGRPVEAALEPPSSPPTLT